MSNDDIIHFETVWEQAESLAMKISEKDISKILSNLKILLDEYNNIHLVNLSDELKKQIKEKKIGEILFSLSELSALENINVYECLVNENKLNNN